ncbi:hypothetical protein LCGC14_1342670 [marine sediment metagenome]|uniref:SF4 helicase domain-containing protein n=1 Tax=marine sediment metagenome TaxID=412755 RepID=A0A0F9MU29_9ZZZZ
MEKLTAGIIRDWASGTVGWWTTRQLDEDLEVGSPEGKNVRRVSLHRMCQDGAIEKHPHQEGKYRYIRKDYHKLNPKADPGNVLSLHWPYAREDGTSFGLNRVKIYPKSVIVLAGVSNACKTAWCLNFLVENMEHHHCMYMTNELSDEEFVDRMSNFEWAELTNGDGEWKFDAVEHFENYHDILQPDAVNIIDYLDPGENPYYIGVLIDQIRQKLNKGIAVIAIQKRITSWIDKEGNKKYSYAEYGTGGQYSEHRARLVLHFDPTEDHHYTMLIKKSKVYGLNGRRFKFDIIKNGSTFHHIEEMEE